MSNDSGLAKSDKPKQPEQTKSVHSASSLGVEQLQAFIDTELPERDYTLYAPNGTVAKIWAKAYPGWTIKLSQRLPQTVKPTKTKRER